MVNIKLPDNYLLLSDSKQYIVARQDGDRVNNISYHTTLEEAIKSFFRLKIRLSNANSINSLMLYQKSLLTALSKALQPLEIEVKPLKSEVKQW